MIVLPAGLIIAFGAISYSTVKQQQKQQQIDINSIYIGMDEIDMLNIMAKYKYSKNLLSDYRVKYEFRFSDGVNTSSKGMRTYYPVSKITIYCSDGRVNEVRPFNV